MMPWGDENMMARRLDGFVAIVLAMHSAGAVSQTADHADERVMAPLVADTIYDNGRIFTPTGWAESFAVGKGLILAVGDAQAVLANRGPHTRVVDLHGAVVFPGLNDAHVHVRWAGLELIKCNIGADATQRQMIETVKACVAGRPRGEWIEGGGWTDRAFAQEPVSRAALDAVSAGHPVVLGKQGDFGTTPIVWANSMALKMAGVSLDSEKPAGGPVARDRHGVPTGVLSGEAAMRIMRLIPLPDRKRNVRAVEAGLDEMLSNGVTSFTDAMAEEEDLQIYAELFDAGRLRQRVKACLRWSDTDARAAAEALIRNRRYFARERISTDCVKLYPDGAPMDRTSRMLAPYEGDPDNRGVWNLQPERLKELAIAFDARGLTLKIHATGDGSVRAALDAIEAARKANGWTAHLHEVAHNSFVSAQDLPRARQIGAVFEYSPYIWYPTPMGDAATRPQVGDWRMEREHPAREALDAGALLVGGSDWPYSAAESPWLGIETLVTRKAPGGSGKALAPKEAITLREAIDMFTVNAAKGLGKRAERGAIEAGLLADFVILDRNPLQIPITEVHETRATQVYIQGEQVYPRH